MKKGKKMDIKVPEDILTQTTKCRHDFSCLKAQNCENHETCKIEYVDGHNILFLMSREPAECPYRMAFGHRQICTCPAHYYFQNVK